jgi:hypothetical protein
MRALFILIVIVAALVGASYVGARFTAGRVVGPSPGLGPVTAQFAYEGLPGLRGKPRGWIIAYPQAREFGRDGAEVYVSMTGDLLGTWPEDLAEQMEAKRSKEP